MTFWRCVVLCDVSGDALVLEWPEVVKMIYRFCCFPLCLLLLSLVICLYNLFIQSK